MKKRELLAPAGDIEAGYAALYYGADAVYLGLAKFSARATAINFDEPALNEFTAYAHNLQRKVYVTINTLVQESELSALLESLDICARCRVDGIIIQDLGVARIIREQYPQFEMHASTQMAVHNKEGALFLQKMGFKRVVLARELTAAEIKEIAAIPGLETEAFIHGALCYSYSGLCLFSSLEYGRSANRGKCLYPCRASFKCNGRESHLFSMKDMALQEDILQMPVDSLKIEGRKKSALYVAAVTDYYRQILDGQGADINREERIKQIFSRPWCKFHFKGKDKNIIDREFVGHRGLEIGKVENIVKGRLIFKTTHKIARYDGLQIDVAGDEKPYGFSVQKLFNGHRNVFEVTAEQIAEIELPHGYPALKRGEKIYLASSGEVKGAYHYEKPKPGAFKQTADIEVKVTVSPEEIKATCDNYQAVVKGNFTPTEHPEKSTLAIKNAFEKTGDTEFNLRDLQIDNPQNLFTPASLLNELRRNLYAQIKIESPKGRLPAISDCRKRTAKPEFKLKIDNLDYLNLLDLNDFSEIIYLLNPQSKAEEIRKLPKNKVRLALPEVCRQPKLFEPLIKSLVENGYHKWEIGNWWGLEILPATGLDISFDAAIYMLNSQAIEAAKNLNISEITLSLEDNKVNICNLLEKSQIKTTVVMYRDVPLFTSACCIRDNDCAHCNRQPQWFNLDREGHKFKALSENCQIMVFDEKPFCIAGEAADLRPDAFRIDFMYCRYTPETVRDTINKLLKFENITDCIKGNFLSNNL